MKPAGQRVKVYDLNTSEFDGAEHRFSAVSCSMSPCANCTQTYTKVVYPLERSPDKHSAGTHHKA